MSEKKQKEKKPQKLNNLEFSKKDEKFKGACTKASVTPTKRQASKYRMGHGLSFKSKGKVKDDNRINPVEELSGTLRI